MEKYLQAKKTNKANTYAQVREWNTFSVKYIKITANAWNNVPVSFHSYIKYYCIL